MHRRGARHQCRMPCWESLNPTATLVPATAIEVSLCVVWSTWNRSAAGSFTRTLGSPARGISAAALDAGDLAALPQPPEDPARDSAARPPQGAEPHLVSAGRGGRLTLFPVRDPTFPPARRGRKRPRCCRAVCRSQPRRFGSCRCIYRRRFCSPLSRIAAVGRVSMTRGTTCVSRRRGRSSPLSPRLPL